MAALTLLSVVCAESMTATSSSKGLEYSSSVFGSGLAAARRRKIARRVAGCTARTSDLSRERVRCRPSACARRAGHRARERGGRCARCERRSVGGSCAHREPREHRQDRTAESSQMQSTGHGAMQSSQPVQSAVMMVCICLRAPMIASTGQGGRHLAQPMQSLRRSAPPALVLRRRWPG